VGKFSLPEQEMVPQVRGMLPAQDLGAVGARDLSGRGEKCDISETVRLYGKFFVNLPGFKIPLGGLV